LWATFTVIQGTRQKQAQKQASPSLRAGSRVKNEKGRAQFYPSRIVTGRPAFPRRSQLKPLHKLMEFIPSGSVLCGSTLVPSLACLVETIAMDNTLMAWPCYVCVHLADSSQVLTVVFHNIQQP